MKNSCNVFNTNQEPIVPKDARQIRHNGDKAYVANMADDRQLASVALEDNLIRRPFCDALQQHALETSLTCGQARDLFAGYLLKNGFLGGERTMTLDDTIELFNMDRSQADLPKVDPEIIKSAQIVLVRAAELNSSLMLNPAGSDPGAFPANPSPQQLQQILASLSADKGGPDKYEEIAPERVLDLALEYNMLRRANGVAAIPEEIILEELLS